VFARIIECYGLMPEINVHSLIHSFIMNSILKTNSATLTPHSTEMAYICHACVFAFCVWLWLNL